MSEAACSLNCDHISLRVILKFCLIIVFSWEKRETNQYFSINTNWHSSPLYWLILQIFLGITVISFCYWSINYNPMWALLCHFLQFFSLFSMYCHLMAYPCVFQNNLFKGCVKKRKKNPENKNTIDILHIYLELTKAVRVVDVFFCSWCGSSKCLEDNNLWISNAS